MIESVANISRPIIAVYTAFISFFLDDPNARGRLSRRAIYVIPLPTEMNGEKYLADVQTQFFLVDLQIMKE